MSGTEWMIYGALIALPLGVLLYQWRAGLLTRERWQQSLQAYGGWPGVLLTLALFVLLLASGIVGLLLIVFVWGLAGVLRVLFMR